jgi:hypothetical protein
MQGSAGGGVECRMKKAARGGSEEDVAAMYSEGVGQARSKRR